MKRVAKAARRRVEVCDCRRPKLSRVKQLEERGCGVACVASVTRHTYDCAHAKLFRSSRRHLTSGFLIPHMMAALKRAGLKYTEKKFPRSEKEMGMLERVAECARAQNGSIVLVKSRHPEHPYYVKRGLRCPGHYLVKVPGGWMDPWRNKVRVSLPERLPRRLLTPVARSNR